MTTPAPRPGVSRRQEETSTAAEVIVITLLGDAKPLAWRNLPFSEKAYVRKVTDGLPLEAYWNGGVTVQSDSLQLLWCLARRANGEPGHRIEQTIAEWPEPFDLSMVKIEMHTPDDDLDEDEHPES